MTPRPLLEALRQPVGEIARRLIGEAQLDPALRKGDKMHIRFEFRAQLGVAHPPGEENDVLEGRERALRRRGALRLRTVERRMSGRGRRRSAAYGGAGAV